MKRIYKYTLEAQTEQKLELPLGSQVLTVKEQRNDAVLYALVNPNEEKKEVYQVLAFGTGHDIEYDLSDYNFLNSVLLYGGNLVFHLFIKRIG